MRHDRCERCGRYNACNSRTGVRVIAESKGVYGSGQMDVTPERKFTNDLVRAGAVAALVCLAGLCLLAGDPGWWWVPVLVGAGAATVGAGLAVERWLPDTPDEPEDSGSPVASSLLRDHAIDWPEERAAGQYDRHLKPPTGAVRFTGADG